MPGDTSIVNINSGGVDKNSFDAIVIGSGISGGWAAKELCEHGLKTVVLERGRNVVHLKDYPTATKAPWEFPHREQLPISITKANPIVARCYAFDEATAHFFVKDKEHPYIQEKPFDWIRGYQVGANQLSGQGKLNGGVSTILRVLHVMALLLTGLFGMRILLPGIRT